MQNNSNTSIKMLEKIQLNQKNSVSNVRRISGDLIALQKQSPSIIDQNFEPQIDFIDEIDFSHHQYNNQSGASQRLEEYSQQQEKQLVNNIEKNTIGYKQIWLKNGFNILRIIAKFIRTLKISTNNFQYKMINQKMIKILDDKSSSSKLFIQMKNEINLQKKQNSCLAHLKNTKLFLKVNCIIIQPDNSLLVIFRIAVILFLIFNVIYIPLNFFFQDFYQQQEYILIFDEIPVTFCILDSMFKLITAYYNQGVLVNDFLQIIINYCQNDFILDIICIIPTISQIQSLQFLNILRLVRLKYLSSEIEEVIYFKGKIQGYLQLLKSIFFILYVYHFCACIWYWFGQSGLNIQTGWIVKYQFEELNFSQQYCYSLYFIVITTLTIGYGDILPTTQYEIIFVIFLAFTGCSVLGYTINNIGEVLKAINEKDVQYKQQMRIIQQYLKDSEINQNLSLQVKKYFQYHLREQIETKHDDYHIIKQLPKKLQEDMCIDLYKKYLQKIRIIKDNCSEDTINQLCQYVKLENYSPGTIIFEQGNNPLKLFYLINGEVELYVKLPNKEISIIKSLKSEIALGQWDCLTLKPYFHSIKTVKHSQILSINLDKLYTIINNNKYDYEKLCQMKDKLIFQSLQYGKKCYICDWIHYFDKCPFIFFIPNKIKLFNKYNKNEQQNRKKHNRKRVKMSLLKNIQNIRNVAVDFIMESENEFNQERLKEFGFTNQDSLFDDNLQYISERSLESSEQQNEQQVNQVQLFKHNKFKSNETQEFSTIQFNSHTIEFNKQQNQGEIRQREISQCQQTRMSKVQLPSVSKIESRLNFLKQHNNNTDFHELIGNSNIQNQNHQTQEGLQINNQLLNNNNDQLQKISYHIDKIQKTKYYFVEGNIETILQTFNSRIFQNIHKQRKFRKSHLKLQGSEQSKKKLQFLKI